MKAGMIQKLPKPLRSINRLVRYKSDTPDNAPRANDNEVWLEEFVNDKEQSRRSNLWKSSQDISIKTETRKKSIITRGWNSKIDYKVISTPPTSSFIEVESPLSNFTSISYLQQNKNFRNQKSNFVDVRIIKCKSGKGGSGCVSFFRDRGRAIGPPDGGDGGDGGSVFVQAVEGINSLSKLKATYIAEDGSNGAADQLDGSKGKDVLITVPVGTVVKWCIDPNVIKGHVNEKIAKTGGGSLREILSNSKVILKCTGRFSLDQKPSKIQNFRESYKPGEGWIFKGKDEAYHLEKEWFQQLNDKVTGYDNQLLESELEEDQFPLLGLDLDKPTDKPICILKGGKGGLGNMHFLTNLIRNPRFAKIGRAGLEQNFMFELKSIADLGLIGLPNAGKSTILDRISNARPRIGHWEFTTLHPTIGTISLGIDKPTFTVADIPGIIRDASLDKGMGLEFLRHIERSNGWVFVISLEKKDPTIDLKLLIDELGGMDAVLAKNILIICNKADIDENTYERYLKINKLCDRYGWDVIPISALKGENIEALLEKMAKCAGKI